MVLDFYKLTELPFGVTPDPKFLFLGPTHREALASILHGLAAGRGLTALIAGAGMGKTSLLNLLLQNVQNNALTASLANSHCSPRELLTILLTSLGIEDDIDNFSGMHKKLNDALVQEHKSQKRFVVVIDEAQNLPDPTLECLRVLSNVETPREKLIHFVLAGHSRLVERLASPHLTQLRQRVSIFVRLEPFDEDETRSYINHRLRIAGYDMAKSLFTEPALHLIARHTWGVPRNINNVCFNALSLGFVKRQNPIGVDVVEEVLKDLDLQTLIAAGAEVPFPAKTNIGNGRSTNESDASIVGEIVASTPQIAHGADLRRSSRIVQPVSLVVLGTDQRGESFQDQAYTVSMNLQGCRYSSRRDYPVGSRVTLQVRGQNGETTQPVRARVCSVDSSNEICQVGVELETPGNVWGVSAPPEDWRRHSGVRAATAVGPAVEHEFRLPLNRPASTRQTAGTTEPPNLPSAANEAGDERIPVGEPTLTEARETADPVAHSAIESRVDEYVRSVFDRIDDAWKANLSKAEELFDARLAEIRVQQDTDLVYRERTKKAARRMKLLAARAGQGLLELQGLAAKIKDEIELQVQDRFANSLAQAGAEFETRAADISKMFLAQFTEKLQTAVHAAHPAPQASETAVSEERLKEVVNFSHQNILEHIEELLADMRLQARQQQDLVGQRTDEFAHQLTQLAATLRQSQMQQDQSAAEFRSLFATQINHVTEERVESWMNATLGQIDKQVESRLGEVSLRADREKELLRQGAEELRQRIEHLAGQIQSVWTRQDEKIAELGLVVDFMNHSAVQQQIDRAVASLGEQFSSRVDDRLSKISVRVDQQDDAARQSQDEVNRRFEQLAVDMRSELEDLRKTVRHLNREDTPQNLAVIEQTAERAKRDIENLAARVADRELVRMIAQKQALANELSLELEARANEARFLLDKSAQTILNEFGRRFEQQIDLTLAEANERVTSALASQQAEHQAILEVKRRAMESEVLHIGEQSMATFRSGMKAFLYSCLVAAVGAVDQHAQNTLGGLSNDPDRN